MSLILKRGLINLNGLHYVPSCLTSFVNFFSSPFSFFLPFKILCIDQRKNFFLLLKFKAIKYRAVELFSSFFFFWRNFAIRFIYFSFLSLLHFSRKRGERKKRKNLFRFLFALFFFFFIFPRTTNKFCFCQKKNLFV